MTIYDELKNDHDEIRTLVDALLEAGSPELRKELIKEVRDLLVPHSRAEEAVLYNVLRDLDATQGLIGHAYGEHAKAEALLRGLQVSEAVALNWKSGVKKLKEDLEHHIRNEEGNIFKAARAVFSVEDATALGKAFVALKLKSSSDLAGSQLELMANMMPKAFRKSFVSSLEGGQSKQAS